MTRLPEGKTRLDLVREGLAGTASTTAAGKKRGRLLVSITKLREDPRNERKTYRNMDGLIASVKAVGLIEPITVTPEEGASAAAAGEAYKIVTGHRRYRAAKAAGLEVVEVLVRDPEDELTRRRKSVISNVQREDVGPVEMAEALAAMLEEDAQVKSQDDLARAIGKDKTWVSGMLRILSLPVQLQRRVSTSQLSIPYDAMIRVARLDDPAQQRQLVDMLLGGATGRDVRRHIDALKGVAKEPDEKEPAAGGKPKRVYHTKYKATVIVQSTTRSLSDDQVIEALQEALGRALNGGGEGSSDGGADGPRK